MNKDSLGDRMKVFYEDAYRVSLPMRLPIIVRIDGSHFHSYTRNCVRPFDDKLSNVMDETAIELCKNIQGARLAYVQSDETSILINNYTSLNSEAWFSNNIQKMTSVAASIAGSFFTANSWKIWTKEDKPSLVDIKQAYFDARVFVLPKEEVCNYFLWRETDASRNSVQMVARSLYSHKELNNKNISQMQDMIHAKGMNWNDLPIHQKRGRCIVKQTYMKDDVQRSRWVVDFAIPIFSQDRDYINREVFTELKE